MRCGDWFSVTLYQNICTPRLLVLNNLLLHFVQEMADGGSDVGVCKIWIHVALVNTSCVQVSERRSKVTDNHGLLPQLDFAKVVQFRFFFCAFATESL